MDWQTGIKAALATIGTAGTYLWGGWDAILTALITLTVLDYVSGMTAAFVEKRLNSEICARGIARKVLMFCVVAVAHILDGAIGFEELLLRTVVIWFYLAKEGLSVIENSAAAGIPIPDVLRNALEHLRSKGQSKEG